VLSLSGSSTFSIPEGHPVAAYVFFLLFPSLISFIQCGVLERSSHAKYVESN
jgi:hypothetical protein